MNHKLLSNILFGCSIGVGLEAIYQIAQHDYPDVMVLGLISCAIMYVSWVIFKHRER